MNWLFGSEGLFWLQVLVIVVGSFYGIVLAMLPFVAFAILLQLVRITRLLEDRFPPVPSSSPPSPDLTRRPSLWNTPRHVADRLPRAGL